MVYLNNLNLGLNFGNVLSWEKSLKNLQRSQSRLLKAVYVGDIRKALLIQKIILCSNSSRLLAIREVTQIGINRKVSGVDGKTFLTFTERFELSEFLKLNVANWQPQVTKKVSFLKKDGTSKILKVPTIADRVWQCLITFVIEPAHLAVFHPHSFNSYLDGSLFDLQKLILLNLSKSSKGSQKRVLLISLERDFSDFNVNFLLKKLIAPRGVKLGIFRSLKKGLVPSFLTDNRDIFALNNILANILIDGIEDLHFCFRCNSYLLFFLYPNDNEKIVLKKIFSFLRLSEINLSFINEGVFSSLYGFDFLDWNFKFSWTKDSYSTPSLTNYHLFLKRVKQIINNSNYGAVRLC